MWKPYKFWMYSSPTREKIHWLTPKLLNNRVRPREWSSRLRKKGLRLPYLPPNRRKLLLRSGVTPRLRLKQSRLMLLQRQRLWSSRPQVMPTRNWKPILVSILLTSLTSSSTTQSSKQPRTQFSCMMSTEPLSSSHEKQSNINEIL